MQRRRLLVRAAATTTAAVSVVGCLGGSDDEYDVGMTATEFRPQELTVSVGETVVWRNTSSRAHTVSAYENSIPEDAPYFASGGFDDETTARDSWWANRGGAIDHGEEFAYTFDIPGRYDYVCIPHEQGGMLGVVLVEV